MCTDSILEKNYFYILLEKEYIEFEDQNALGYVMCVTYDVRQQHIPCKGEVDMWLKEMRTLQERNDYTVKLVWFDHLQDRKEIVNVLKLTTQRPEEREQPLNFDYLRTEIVNLCRKVINWQECSF